MTNEASVFDGTNTGTVTTQASTQVDNGNGAGNLLNTLVGEGKKFKSVEDLARGKIEADNFIETLKKEKAEAEAKLATQNKLDSFLSEYEQTKANSQAQSNTSSGLGREDIAEIVRNEITQTELVRTASQNISAVDAKVKEVFGEKAKDFLVSKANELNLSVQDLKEISAKSPSAFFNIVGLTKDTSTNSSVSITKGSINTESDFNNKEPKVGTSEYYKNLRKNNKKVYYSKEVQDEIYRRVSSGELQL